MILKETSIPTPLGAMIAISDETSLYLLEFLCRKGLDKELTRLQKKLKAEIIPGRTFPIDSMEQELSLYFKGQLKAFATPLFLMGSPFQQRVWTELRKIPYGATLSYADLAKAIGQPRSYRAVARANGTNQCALVIPCHRVIQSDGTLGGYAGGVTHKQWLLTHERNHR